MSCRPATGRRSRGTGAARGRRTRTAACRWQGPEIDRGQPAAANRPLPSGVKATQFTVPWSSTAKRRSSCPVARSQTLTVPSLPPDASDLPSGAKAARDSDACRRRAVPKRTAPRRQRVAVGVEPGDLGPLAERRGTEVENANYDHHQPNSAQIASPCT